MYQAELPPSVSDALMHPYRALQHFEEIARIGAALPQQRAERPALDSHTEHLMDAYLTMVRQELKTMTSPDPLPDDWSPKVAREHLREAYGALKMALLAAGSRGDLQFQQLDDTINFIDHVHTCGVRAVKAERRLRLISAAAQGIVSPENGHKNTDDV
jgi:hypothetical protein